MNNIRRKEIKKVVTAIEDLLDKLEELKDEEQEYIDNMPENLQMSDKAMEAESNVETMDDAISDIKEALDNLWF